MPSYEPASGWRADDVEWLRVHASRGRADHARRRRRLEQRAERGREQELRQDMRRQGHLVPLGREREVVREEACVQHEHVETVVTLGEALRRARPSPRATRGRRARSRPPSRWPPRSRLVRAPSAPGRARRCRACAPWPAIVSAAQRPSPDVAPVTTTTLPSSRNDASGVQRNRRRRAWKPIRVKLPTTVTSSSESTSPAPGAALTGSARRGAPRRRGLRRARRRGS